MSKGYAGKVRSPFSDYPDCRPAFIEAFETLANVATNAGAEGAGIRIYTPLMKLGKGDIVTEGVRLGFDFSETISGYQADAQDRACGHCDACRLRAEGFCQGWRAGYDEVRLRSELSSLVEGDLGRGRPHS